MYIEGDLRVSGIVEGEVEVTGDVAIDDLAKVKASVTARDVSISGSVVGAIVARKRLEVTRSGSLIGDVRVARLTIQDGATFSGKVSMGAAAEAPAKGAETKPVVAETKPVAVEPKAVVPEPVVKAPVVTPPVAPPPTAKAPVAPLPATKAQTVPPPAAKAQTAPPLAAKAQTAPPPAAKPPVAPHPVAKAPAVAPKTQPRKGKPKRR